MSGPSELGELRERVIALEAALQNKCHDLPESDYEAFCDGCDRYQREQFGKCRTDELRVELERLKSENARLWQHVSCLRNQDAQLQCPKCGSDNGCLGTQNAYWICEEGCGEVYYIGDGRHPVEQGLSWDEAVLASPFTRKPDMERELERLREGVKKSLSLLNSENEMDTPEAMEVLAKLIDPNWENPTEGADSVSPEVVARQKNQPFSFKNTD